MPAKKSAAKKAAPPPAQTKAEHDEHVRASEEEYQRLKAEAVADDIERVRVGIAAVIVRGRQISHAMTQAAVPDDDTTRVALLLSALYDVDKNKKQAAMEMVDGVIDLAVLLQEKLKAEAEAAGTEVDMSSDTGKKGWFH